MIKFNQAHLFGAFLLTALVCVGHPSHAAADEASTVRTISVTGTAVTRTPPDTVVWHVTTTTAHRVLVRAKEESDSQMQAILAAAKSLDVNADDLQTGFLDVSKEYEEGEYGEWGEFKQFRVTRQITIKERDTTRFDEFLTKLIKSADIEVRYTLESSRLAEIRTETRLKSVTIAREKAEAMAGALGAEIGDVLTIKEQDEYGYGLLSANHTEWDGVMLEEALSEGSTGTFAPGSIEVRVSVGTVFELK